MGLVGGAYQTPNALSIALLGSRSIRGSAMDGGPLAIYPLLLVDSGSDIRSSGHLGGRSYRFTQSADEGGSQGNTGILHNA
jgi:hypothetical protein